jgi:hypothetical protein
VKTVDEPGVEELVQVEEDVGVLVLRVQLQFESREDVAHHHPNDVVEQPRGQVEGVRLTASSLPLEKNVIYRTVKTRKCTEREMYLFYSLLQFVRVQGFCVQILASTVI